MDVNSIIVMFLKPGKSVVYVKQKLLKHVPRRSPAMKKTDRSPEQEWCYQVRPREVAAIFELLHLMGFLWVL